MQTPQTSDLMISINNCSQYSLSQYIPTNRKFWLNYTILSEINNTEKSLCEQSFQFQNIYTGGVYNILNLIDRSKLILYCINRQNIKIKQLMTCHIRSVLNYEKIKLIDLMKFLIINQKCITEKLAYLHENLSCFSNEMLKHVQQLNELSSVCNNIQINEEEITKDFNLSSHVVDKIINDCGSDLTEIEKIIFDKQTELYKKFNSINSSSNRKIEKFRFGRLCNKTLQLFQLELSQNFILISKILERLICGHFASEVNRTKIVSPETELPDYQMEISIYQLQKIVAMQHVTQELEKKIQEHIIEIMGFQMLFSLDKNVSFGEHVLSPINNVLRMKSINTENRKSFITSTPIRGNRSNRFPTSVPMSFQSVEINPDQSEDSVSSFDSGYLMTPGNEQASLMGSCDNFDVIPFSDDEYEKIEEDENEPVTKEDMRPESAIDSPKSSRDSIFTLPESGSAIEFCNNNLCRISRFNRYLFPPDDDNPNKPLFHKFSEMLTRSELQSVLNFDFDRLPTADLCASEKQDMRHRISALVANDHARIYFTIILEIALSKSAQRGIGNPLTDTLKCLEQLAKSFPGVDRKYGLLNDGQWEQGLVGQNNNSACNAHIIPATGAILEQNTNNNADSRDEDSSEYSASQFGDDAVDPIGLDMELRDAFEHILSDMNRTDNGDRLVDIGDLTTTSSSTESIDGASVGNCNPYNDTCFLQYRDVAVNSSTYSDAHCHESESICSDDEPIERKPNSFDSPKAPIDDIDLVLKLSELHLGSEFRAEQHNRSVIVADRNRVVGNYWAIATSMKETADYHKQSSATRIGANQNESQHIKAAGGHEPQRSCLHHPNSQCSCEINISSRYRNHNSFSAYSTPPKKSRDSQSSPSILQLQPVKHVRPVMENVQKIVIGNSQSTIERVFHTIKAAGKLLEITSFHLKFVSSMFHNNSSSMKSSLLRNKSLLVSCLHQRVKYTFKILSSMKYAIQTSDRFIIYNQSISEIDKLMDLCESLFESTRQLKAWMKRGGCEIDKDGGFNFQPELPDYLLIKMDPNDYKTIVSISSRRLQITIEALSTYPCYDNLLTLYRSKFKEASQSFMFNFHRIGDCVHHLDLVQKLCKLRRVHAICAFNIVDLHVLLNKLESDQSSDCIEAQVDVRNLLVIWRAVDGESHRLLKSSSLIHHVMGVARHHYVDMVSIIAVMQSVLATVDLSDNESGGIKTNINTLMDYKSRVVEWLEEVDVCVAIIYKKRMTNKRFHHYEDIHNYIEVNLKTISELVDKIKNECQRAVKLVYQIMTYCASLPDCSITYLGNVLTSLNNISNRQIIETQNENGHINEKLFSAIVDLEDLSLRMSNILNTETSHDHLRDLISQGRDIVHRIDGENSNLFVSDSREVTNHQDAVIAIASDKINEKVLEIALKAATKALLAFVDKFDISVSINDSAAGTQSPTDCMRVVVEITSEIIDDISRTFDKNGDVTELQSDGSRDALPLILATGDAVDEAGLTELPVSGEAGTSVSGLCEQFRCQMLSSCLEELQLVEYRLSLCVSRCVMQLTDRADLECQSSSSVSMLAELQSNLGMVLQLLYQSVPGESAVRDCSAELEGMCTRQIHEVPVSYQKQSYCSHKSVESFTRMYDFKQRLSGRYDPTCGAVARNPGAPVLETVIPAYWQPESVNKVKKLVAQFSKPNLKSRIDTGHHNRLSSIRGPFDQVALELVHASCEQITDQVAHQVSNESSPFVWVQPAEPTEMSSLLLSDMECPTEIRSHDYRDLTAVKQSNQIENTETASLSCAGTIQRGGLSTVPVHSTANELLQELQLTEFIVNEGGNQISQSVLTALAQTDSTGSLALTPSDIAEFANPPNHHQQQPITSCPIISMTTSTQGPMIEWNCAELDSIHLSDPKYVERPEDTRQVELALESICHLSPPNPSVKALIATPGDVGSVSQYEVVSTGTIVPKGCEEIVTDRTESAQLVLPVNDEPSLRQRSTYKIVCKNDQSDSTLQHVTNHDMVSVSSGLTQDQIAESVNRNCNNRSVLPERRPDRSDTSQTRPKHLTTRLAIVVVILILLVLALLFFKCPLGFWCSSLVVPESLLPRITTRGVPF